MRIPLELEEKLFYADNGGSEGGDSSIIIRYTIYMWRASNPEFGFGLMCGHQVGVPLLSAYVGPLLIMLQVCFERPNGVPRSCIQVVIGVMGTSPLFPNHKPPVFNYARPGGRGGNSKPNEVCGSYE